MLGTPALPLKGNTEYTIPHDFKINFFSHDSQWVLTKYNRNFFETQDLKLIFFSHNTQWVPTEYHRNFLTKQRHFKKKQNRIQVHEHLVFRSAPHRVLSVSIPPNTLRKISEVFKLSILATQE